MENIEWRDRKREGSIESRLKEMERNMERREKEKRTKNIIMRGVKIREGKRRKAVEILKILRAKAEIKEIRRIGEIIEKGGKMMLIKLTRKRRVKGGDNGGKEKFEKKKERITEDLT